MIEWILYLTLMPKDLERFESQDICIEQLAEYKVLKERLIILRGQSDDKRLGDKALKEVQWNIEYWQWLFEARKDFWSIGLCRQYLDGLRNHIGYKRYYKGWHPNIIKEYTFTKEKKIYIINGNEEWK